MRLALVGLQAIIRSMGEIVYVQKHPIEYSRGLSFIRRRSLRRAPGVGQIVMTLEKSNYPLQQISGVTPSLLAIWARLQNAFSSTLPREESDIVHTGNNSARKFVRLCTRRFMRTNQPRAPSRAPQLTNRQR